MNPFDTRHLPIEVRLDNAERRIESLSNRIEDDHADRAKNTLAFGALVYGIVIGRLLAKKPEVETEG
jgi:hypothetical protein